MKILFVMCSMLLASCSTHTMRSENRLSNRPSATEAVNGMSRLSCLMNDALTLTDYKVLFKEDFDAKSKKYNPQTKCCEYEAHIYPSLNQPVLLGFDSNNQYAYFIDNRNSDPEKRGKVTWVKELKKDLENTLDRRFKSHT
jgi:hypothetical protein